MRGITLRQLQAGLTALLMVGSTMVAVDRLTDDSPAPGDTAVPVVPPIVGEEGPEREADPIEPRSPATVDVAPVEPPRTPVDVVERSTAVAPRAPLDYIALAERLSQPDFPETIREAVHLEAHDGIELYLEVVRPDPDEHGKGPWPVILEASPYHGTVYDRTGTRILPDPRGPNGARLGLTGYFAPRGYAVVMMDLRGTGRSQGCLDHLGPDDAADIAHVVEWSADQEWSNGRVGITGHSYPGSTPQLAAAKMPHGLATIVPSAGLASMYDHQFQMGVPYSLQWVGPMYAYEELALCRHIPSPFCGTTRGGDNALNDMEYFGCGIPNSAILAGHGQVNGQYQEWHAERDHRDAASAADIPVFMIHGVNDNAARIPAAEWFFGRRFDREEDKVWIGQWDHGSGVHPNRRGDQWTNALHAWFDRHLAQRDVDTGPAVEAFLNTGKVHTEHAWLEPTEWLTLHADGSALDDDTPGDGSVTFRPPPLGTTRGVSFTSPRFASSTVLLGLPRLHLSASVTTSQVIHLTATLESVRPGGVVTHASTCAIQPQLRDGIDSTTPVIPGQRMELEPQCFTMAHHVRAGDRLRLSIGTTSGHHFTFPTAEPAITVYTGPGATRIEVPLASDDVVYEDVLEPQTGQP